MDLGLSFRAGSLRGDGLDDVGLFVVDGRYDARDGGRRRPIHMGVWLDLRRFAQGVLTCGLWLALAIQQRANASSARQSGRDKVSAFAPK